MLTLAIRPALLGVPRPVYKPCRLNTLDTLDTEGQGSGSSLFLDSRSDVLGNLLLYSCSQGRVLQFGTELIGLPGPNENFQVFVRY